MDHLTKAAPRLVEEYNAGVDDSAFSRVIPALIKKGLDNVNLSMFSEEKKKELLNAAGEEYLKRNQVTEAIRVFKSTGNLDKLVIIGNEQARVGLFSHAIEAYRLANSKEKLLEVGEKCLQEGQIIEAIAAFKLSGDEP